MHWLRNHIYFQNLAHYILKEIRLHKLHSMTQLSMYKNQKECPTLDRKSIKNLTGFKNLFQYGARAEMV